MLLQRHLQKSVEKHTVASRLKCAVQELATYTGKLLKVSTSKRVEECHLELPWRQRLSNAVVNSYCIQ